MKIKFSTLICIILLGGYVLCSLHSVLSFFFPIISDPKHTYDIFWSSSYHNHFTIEGYMYYFENFLFTMILFYVICRLSFRISKKIWLGSVTLLIEQIVEGLFFMYDMNPSGERYYILLCSVLIIGIEIILPEKKLAKIIEIE